MKVFGAKAEGWQSLLASILKTEYGIAPLPELVRGEEGKPFFPQFPALQFSISHAGDYVLCALSDRPVGVDIEVIRSRREGLPRYALTSPEYANYEALGGDWPAFYTIWTRKEAWCKYVGQGLRRLWGQTPPREGLHFRSYQGPDWRAAVCGEEDPPEAITWLEGPHE
ncbi:MAG: 4'-phosphopantetheinyl transferase superfamily protein [Ruminiclostridium sp.]|nr:4'-phosphopantetheinyl transferase superfamily protein [Ruminiclostridium sp.]